VAKGSALLQDSPASVQKHALNELTRLGVDTRLNATVADHAPSPSGGQTELTLSDGTPLLTDLYIPTFGLTPNSDYVPPAHLRSTGYIAVDDHLRMKGGAAATATDVWALGDVADVEWNQYITMDKQSAYVAKSIVAILSGGAAAAAYKPSAYRKIGPSWVFGDDTLIMLFRYTGLLAWERHCDRSVWQLQDAELRDRVGAQGTLYSEDGADGEWGDVLIVVRIPILS
jgi:NADH dehydrogenase FAD-containing subunit